MEREVIITKDGSHTITVSELNVTYHSVHGAIQESLHVFIDAGFYGSGYSRRPDPFCILEVGFGTGLNALLTLIEAEKFEQKIFYEAIEPFPLADEQIKSLNYCERLHRNDLQNIFAQLHNCNWEKEIKISEIFYLHKTKQTLQNYRTKNTKNLIYFDAFAPNTQPELWTKEIFEKLYSMTLPGGILVTYCSKGEIRRNMEAAVFIVEKIPGPPGKREMIRAKKRSQINHTGHI